MSGLAFAPFFVTISAFTVVFCVVWSGMALYRDYIARKTILEKVRNETSCDEQALDFQEQKPNSILSLFGKIGNRYVDEKQLKYSVLKLEFLRAGIRNGLSIPAFWGIKISLVVALPLIFFLSRVVFFGIGDRLLTMVICGALGFAGLYLPDLWLRLLISLRKTRITRSLPDALDMLVVCVEAGLGLDAAISRVSEEIRLVCPDLSDELHLYNLEMRAGTSRDDALNNLTRRTDLDEIRSLANLLIQTSRFGTSLAQGLRVYAESFRAKRFMQAEERAAKLPTKLMIPVLFCIFPALFVVIALPAGLRIYYAFIASGPVGG